MRRIQWCGLVLACLLAGAIAGNVGPAVATVFTWSQTASSNSNADSSINWAEGQAPGTVNDSARAMMAAVAKFRDDLSGKLNTAGTSTAYTLSSNQTFTSLADGIQIAFRLDEANGAAPTLNVDSLGAKALRLVSATNLAGAELQAGSIYIATYDSGGDEWLIANPVSTGQVPAGTVADFAGTAAPSGWLLMHGQCVSRTTFATLFAVIGTTYANSCSGSEFGIPDARGRLVAGQDDMGGTSANRLTNQTGGLDGDVLGATGGAETHVLTEAQLASHDHPSAGAHGHQYDRTLVGFQNNFAGGTAAAANSSSLQTNNTTTDGAHTHGNAGSGQAHNNVQPTLILNKIIKQ